MRARTAADLQLRRDLTTIRTRGRMAHVKRMSLIGLVGASVAAAVVSASAAVISRPNASRCGGQTWRLATLSDAGRASVALSPKTSTLGSLAGRGAPHPLPQRRSTTFQKQTWEVIAQVTAYRLNGNLLELTLYDAGVYMKA